MLNQPSEPEAVADPAVAETPLRDPRQSPLFHYSDLRVYNDDLSLNEEETRKKQDEFEARKRARWLVKHGKRVAHGPTPIKITSSILRKLKREEQEARDQANAARARESLYVATEMPK